MPESVLTILKYCFLALMYLFLLRVVQIVLREMRTPKPASLADGAVAPAAAPRPARARAPVAAARADGARGRDDPVG